MPPIAAPKRPSRRGRGLRRLLGLDRSGPAPRQTRRGQPLRPLTLPNLVGYVRLAAIPAFLYLALDSGDGRSAAASAIYLAIALGDYLDGFVARATGQYSRMGALLDPVVDRLTILAGVVVCWHFALLPRWALALLGARELVVLAIAQAGLRHGLEIEINWVGRIAVWMTMGGIFLTLTFDYWIGPAMFYAGLVVTLAATVLYVRDGLRRLA